jgi:tetratricopeptide (TPR) repeat protein
VRLGRFEEALKAYRDSVVIREDLLKRDASNVATQRDLMIANGHIGDLLGNPNLPNMGNRDGALDAYGRMLDIARRIHDADPVDQRARSDFAIALSRMAAILPPVDTASRVGILSQAIRLQAEVAQVNSENLSNRIEMAVNHNFLGDAYLSAGDTTQASRVFREGVRLAESMFDSATPTLSGGAVLMYRKLGELLARSEDRNAALAFGQRAMQWADPVGPAASKWPVNAQNVQFARGAAAMGHIHAALAKTKTGQESDKADARRWLGKSLQLYRSLGPQRSPHSLVSKEIKAAESELETLK